MRSSDAEGSKGATKLIQVRLLASQGASGRPSSPSFASLFSPPSPFLSPLALLLQNLLDLRAVFDRFLAESLDSNRDFVHCIGSGFEEIVNLHKRAPEYLSVYVDDKLKRGIKEVRALGNFLAATNSTSPPRLQGHRID